MSDCPPRLVLPERAAQGDPRSGDLITGGALEPLERTLYVGEGSQPGATGTPERICEMRVSRNSLILFGGARRDRTADLLHAMQVPHETSHKGKKSGAIFI